MNKNIPVKIKKIMGVVLLSGVMAFGAFSFLKTSVISTNSNIISATGEDGEIGNNLLLEIGSEQNMLKKYDALPQTKAEAIKETPYTFTISNTGTTKQVIRLNMEDIQASTDGNLSSTTELPKDKINVRIETSGGTEVFEGKLNEIEASSSGFGKCSILEKESGSESFKLYAWIDENVTNEELFGAGNDEKKSIEFKVGAMGVQYDGLFTSADESNLETKFEQALTGAIE